MDDWAKSMSGAEKAPKTKIYIVKKTGFSAGRFSYRNIVFLFLLRRGLFGTRWAKLPLFW